MKKIFLIVLALPSIIYGQYLFGPFCTSSNIQSNFPYQINKSVLFTGSVTAPTFNGTFVGTVTTANNSLKLGGTIASILS